jgi:hypothetical protein
VEGLLPGPHNVEIEARGYEVTRAEVSVGAGATRAVNLVLSKRSQPSIDTLPHSNATPPNAAEPTAPPAADKPAPPVPGKVPVRPVFVRPKVAEPAATAEADNTGSVPEVAAPSPTEASPEPEPAPVAEATDTPPQRGETQMGETIDEDAALAGQGILLISTVPWSRVIIDGSDTGRDTPVRALRVSAGDHLIVLRTPEGEEHTVNVSVAAGRTVRIIRRF